MPTLKQALGRLADPTVLISVASQVVAVLVLLGIEVDVTLVTSVITAAFPILTLLGIVSGPDAKLQAYADDVAVCPRCGKLTPHVYIAGKLTCRNCGQTREQGTKPAESAADI